MIDNLITQHHNLNKPPKQGPGQAETNRRSLEYWSIGMWEWFLPLFHHSIVPPKAFGAANDMVMPLAKK